MSFQSKFALENTARFHEFRPIRHSKNLSWGDWEFRPWFLFERGIFIYLDKNCLFLNEWKDGYAKRARLSLLSSLLTKLISFEIEKIRWELKKKIFLSFVNQMKNIVFLQLFTFERTFIYSVIPNEISILLCQQSQLCQS